MSLFSKMKAEKTREKSGKQSKGKAAKGKGKGKPMAEGQFPDFFKKGGK